jgi:peptidoglycan/LPS O-acetylase OafA/YrhL
MLPLDLRAHNGLRGFLALWVALFHAALYSSAAGKGLTFQASAVMPAFFLLSGFTVAVVYGRTQWALPRCCSCCSCRRAHDPESGRAREAEKAQQPPPSFDWFRFLRNRFARLVPTYWLTLALALPPTIVGFSIAGGMGASPRNTGDIIGATVLSFFGLCTVAGAWPWGSALNGPGWFVCTLLFFYLAFPVVLPAAQRLSDAQLARGICVAYWLQWLLWALVVGIGIGALGGWWTNWRYVFTPATFTPWSRFPVFCSGVFAGLLCLRTPPAEPLPAWPRTIARLLPLPCLESKAGGAASALLWARRKTIQSVLLALLFCAIIVMENCLILVDRKTAYPHFWLQCVVPFAQQELVVGLVRGGGSGGTLVGSVLASRPLMWLGDISMELFLLHWPLIMYVNWARSRQPSLAWPAGISSTCRLTGTCAQYAGEPWYDQWYAARTLPGWGIPVVVAGSVLLAALVHYCFAEPLRKLLRAGPPRPRASGGAPAARCTKTGDGKAVVMVDRCATVAAQDAQCAGSSAAGQVSQASQAAQDAAGDSAAA